MEQARRIIARKIVKVFAADDTKAANNWRRKFHVAKKAFLAAYEGEFKTTTVPEGVRVWRTA